MKDFLTLTTVLLIAVVSSAQQTDTLRFYSEAFATDREIYVSTPESYKYRSDKLSLPVYYILDGQHEWFVNPLLSAIEYLQYTHQIPEAIIVSIPLENRYEECAIQSLKGSKLPLHTFITEEVEQQLQKYRPNPHKIIIGHSFSASFALYSYLKASDYYSAVIAHTPLDHFKELVEAFEEEPVTDLSKISISIGGKAENQDYYHRQAFDRLQEEFPEFFSKINIFIADDASHNAVPIVATPYLLNKIFSAFNDRFSSIAKVDQEYKLISEPGTISEEMQKLLAASYLGGHYYAPEIAELNGLASRYWNSDLTDYTIAVYVMALSYYPKYYDFYLQLYELLLPSDERQAKRHLEKALELVNSLEADSPGKQELIEEINQEKLNNGW